MRTKRIKPNSREMRRKGRILAMFAQMYPSRQRDEENGGGESKTQEKEDSGIPACKIEETTSQNVGLVLNGVGSRFYPPDMD